MNCHACGSEIPNSDIEENRAIIVLRRRYCRDCTALLSSNSVEQSRGPIQRLASHVADLSRKVLGQKRP